MRVLEQITETSGRMVAWFTLLNVLLIFAVVVLRYGFAIGATGLQETALYLHGAVITFAAGYTLKHEQHVRIDIFYHNFSEVGRHWVNFVGTVLFLFPVVGIIFYFSLDYVLASWRYGETSIEPGGLPLVYLQKTLLLVLAITLSLQGVCALVFHGKKLMVSFMSNRAKGNSQ